MVAATRIRHQGGRRGAGVPQQLRRRTEQEHEARRQRDAAAAAVAADLAAARSAATAASRPPRGGRAARRTCQLCGSVSHVADSCANRRASRTGLRDVGVQTEQEEQRLENRQRLLSRITWGLARFSLSFLRAALRTGGLRGTLRAGLFVLQRTGLSIGTSAATVAFLYQNFSSFYSAAETLLSHVGEQP